ncbi:MAG: hypothetical protein NTU60_02855 [Candidatus Aminicenantes bacterium]|nr:hypothetical protein [Candidatus Aminicenantes bacterium]
MRGQSVVKLGLMLGLVLCLAIVMFGLWDEVREALGPRSGEGRSNVFHLSIAGSNYTVRKAASTDCFGIGSVKQGPGSTLTFIGYVVNSTTHREEQRLLSFNATTKQVTNRPIVAPGPIEISHIYVGSDGTVYIGGQFDSLYGREFYKLLPGQSTPTLVQDIKTGTASSSPSAFTAMGDSLYFPADHQTAGTEIIRYDLSSGRVSVVDQWPGPNPSYPSYLAADSARGILYCSAYLPAIGTELGWFHAGDGTTGSKKIYDGAMPGYSSPAYVAVDPSGKVWMNAVKNATTQRRDLQRFDPQMNTVTTVDVPPGTVASTPQYITSNSAGQVAFSAKGSAITGREPYIYKNGTIPGGSGGDPGRPTANAWAVTLVGDLNPGSADSSPSNFYGDPDGSWAFAADDGAHGSEPWFLSAAGTPVMLADINPGSANSFPQAFTLIDGRVYFFATDAANTRDIWSYGPEDEIPMISLSRTSLVFGAAVAGPPTQAQSVIVGNSGTGTLNWTAATSAAWLGVTPASGSGSGQIQISVNTAGLAVGTQTGTVTVSDPNASNSPRTITVTLNIIGAGLSAVPFGDFATPIDGTTGITGAIPVTGWVLDDIEVTQVEVKRDPHAADPTGAIGPDGLVFIGYGIFVEGARPDVETAYPGYPLNYRAGWGYMLLTNFLPAQGNGTFKIHAFATDKDGNRALLGSKTIVCDNAHAVKPFGTIDTPIQGGDASGNLFLNFGWVLTPLPKTVAKDGSAIDVYVDSVKVGNLATAPNVYDQYRVDVATAFPGLNNTSGPVGAYYLDTTKYANGVHTIFWIATDDAGAADGIGSRYFNIVNTGTTAGNSADMGSLRVPVLSTARHREERSDAAIPTMESLSNLPLSFDPLSVKRGFNLIAPPEMIVPDSFGSIHIKMKEVDRIELDFGKGTAYRGYLTVGSELRPLPIGSTLDPRSGVFAWMPGPGFVGRYDLVFVIMDESGLTRKIPVRIRITPKF